MILLTAAVVAVLASATASSVSDSSSNTFNLLDLPEGVIYNLGKYLLDPEDHLKLGLTCKSVQALAEFDAALAHRLFHSFVIDRQLSYQIEKLNKRLFNDQKPPRAYLLKVIRNLTELDLVVLYDRLRAIQYNSVWDPPIKITLSLCENHEDLAQLLVALEKNTDGSQQVLIPDWVSDQDKQRIRALIPREVFQKFDLLGDIRPFHQRVLSSFIESGQVRLLSSKRILLALIRCGIRFELDLILPFIDLDRLSELFPLLIGLFPRSGSLKEEHRPINWAFLDKLELLREAGHVDAVAAVWRLPAVADHFRSQSPSFYQQMTLHHLKLLLAHECPFLSNSKLQWTLLLELDQTAVNALLPSDPDSFLGRNRSKILERGLRNVLAEIDFTEALIEQFPHSDRGKLWSLLVQHGSTSKLQSVTQYLFRWKTSSNPLPLLFSLVKNGKNLAAIRQCLAAKSAAMKDGSGRVAFQNASAELLIDLIRSESSQLVERLVRTHPAHFFCLVSEILNNHHRMECEIASQNQYLDDVQVLFQNLHLLRICFDLLTAQPQSVSSVWSWGS